MGGAAGEHPGVQVPGCGALHRGGDTLSDTLHRHFTLHPSQPFNRKLPLRLSKYYLFMSPFYKKKLTELFFCVECVFL